MLMRCEKVDLVGDNGVAMIFVGGGGTRPMPPGTFSVISGSRLHSGGGVVAEMFRDLHARTRFSKGGGLY